jgi:hypothetical protein
MADNVPPFNFKEAITEMAKQNASDLHPTS